MSVSMEAARGRAIAPRVRKARTEVHAQERRRRQRGTLNRMAQYKLDVFDTSQLDQGYIYRWVSDEGSRIRLVTKQDDYDFVQADEIADFSPDDMTDSEPGGRLRMIVGEKKNGQPLYQYLLRKRRDFWESDNAEEMDYRDDVLAGRVYKGEIENVQIGLAVKDEVKTAAVGGLDEKEFYIPPEATLGHAGRRRGAVAPRAEG